MVEDHPVVVLELMLLLVPSFVIIVLSNCPHLETLTSGIHAVWFIRDY